MNDVNFREWLSLIESSFLQIKKIIKELYNIKLLLDEELFFMFIVFIWSVSPNVFIIGYL